MAESYRYFAFISYSRKDAGAAYFLKRKLEHFRYPVRLVDRDDESRRRCALGEVFLDRRNLPVKNQNFISDIQDAAKQSRYLIFLASPNSAQSPVCDQVECRHFLETHDKDSSLVLPVILQGRVNSSGEDECLCPSLRIPEIFTRNLPSMIPEDGEFPRLAWSNAIPSIIGYLLNVSPASVGKVIDAVEKRNRNIILSISIAVAIVFACLTAWALRAQYLAQCSERLAVRREQEAVKQQKIARDTLLFMTDVFQSADPGVGGQEDATVLSVLRNYAIPRAEKLNTPELQSQVNFTLGSILESLHDTENAQILLKNALETYKILAKENPQAYLSEVGNTCNNLGKISLSKDRFPEAMEYFNKALKIFKAFDSKENDFRTEISIVLDNMGNCNSRSRNFPEAEKCYEQSLSIREAQAKENPDKYRRSLILPLNNIGLFYSTQNRFEEAMKYFDRILEICRSLPQNDISIQLNMADAFINRANIQTRCCQFDLAEKEYHQALATYQALVKSNPETIEPFIADLLNNFSALHAEMGRHRECREEISEAMGIYERLSQKNPDVYLASLARTAANFANICNDSGDFQKSEEYNQKALVYYRRLNVQKPDVYLTEIAQILHCVGVVARKQEQWDVSESALVEAAEILRKMTPQNPILYRNRLANVLCSLGNVYAESGKLNLAKKSLDESVEIFQQLLTDSPSDKLYVQCIETLLTAGYQMSACRQFDEAENVTQKAVQLSREQVKRDAKLYRPILVDSLNYLGFVFSDQEKYSEAEKTYSEAIALGRDLFRESGCFWPTYWTLGLK